MILCSQGTPLVNKSGIHKLKKIIRFNFTWACWTALTKQSNLFTSISEWVCIYRLHIQSTWPKLTKLKKCRNIWWLHTCILKCVWIYRRHIQNKKIRTRKQRTEISNWLLRTVYRYLNMFCLDHVLAFVLFNIRRHE